MSDNMFVLPKVYNKNVNLRKWWKIGNLLTIHLFSAISVRFELSTEYSRFHKNLSKRYGRFKFKSGSKNPKKKTAISMQRTVDKTRKEAIDAGWSIIDVPFFYWSDRVRIYLKENFRKLGIARLDYFILFNQLSWHNAKGFIAFKNKEEAKEALKWIKSNKEALINIVEHGFPEGTYKDYIAAQTERWNGNLSSIEFATEHAYKYVELARQFAKENRGNVILISPRRGDPREHATFKLIANDPSYLISFKLKYMTKG